MLRYQVLRLHTTPAGDNQYGISRAEDWTLRRDQTFPSESEAKAYVRTQSFLKTTLPLYTIDIQDPVRKQRVVDDFCFHDDQYWPQRRFFIIEDRVPHRLQQDLEHHLRVAGFNLRQQ